MLLEKDGKHLCLNGSHLVVQLLETHHLAPVLMYLGLQQTIMHLNQRCVNINGLVPGRQELAEVVVTIFLDMRVIVPGHCMDLSPLCQPVGLAPNT